MPRFPGSFLLPIRFVVLGCAAVLFAAACVPAPFVARDTARFDKGLVRRALAEAGFAGIERLAITVSDADGAVVYGDDASLPDADGTLSIELPVGVPYRLELEVSWRPVGSEILETWQTSAEFTIPEEGVLEIEIALPSTSPPPSPSPGPWSGDTFETYASVAELWAAGWRTIDVTAQTPGISGIVGLAADPLASGRGQVLELRDAVTSAGDPGAVAYSPWHAGITDQNLLIDQSPYFVRMDILFASDVAGRWFMVAKTHASAFVMNDPDGQLDAYWSGSHLYRPISDDTWYTLEVDFNIPDPGTYTLQLRDGNGALVADFPVSGIPNNPDNYDTLHFASGSGDGRLMFGSWFSYTAAQSPGVDTSYGHLYVDNISFGVPVF